MSQTWLKPNHIAIFNACAIGLAAGASAVALTKGVGLIGTLRLHYAHLYNPFIVLPLFGGIGGLIAGLLVWKCPDASGSGIPQVKAALMGASKTALDMRTALIKLVGGIVAIGSGLLMGREGPTVHVGAALSTEINKRAHSEPHKERLLVAAGAGAGLAAAFNAPLAGSLFVLEELLKDISSNTIGTAVLACFVASVVSHMLHGDQSSVHHINAMAANASFSPIETPAYVLMGVVAGMIGAIFNKSVMLCLKFNRDIFRLPVAIKVATAGVVSGLLVATLPVHFHNYAGMREYIVHGDMGMTAAAAACLVFFILTVVAYGSGAPGGLFAPSLAMGSAVGHVCALLQQHIQPNVPLETFALVGMGAVFASVARVPITAIVIVFEMTQNFSLVLPLMLSCIVSSTVADKLYPGSIYDRLIEWSGLLPDEPKAPSPSQP